MAEKKFFVDINLQGSALTNAKIGTNSAIGSTEGAFGFDSASHRLQYFDGTATKDVANLSDISAVTGGLIFQGGYDPTTDTPDITDGSALKGFFWAATAAGTFLGESVQVGDSIVAKVDNAGATIANWLILQGNIVIATNSVDGISRLATQTEANDGTEGGAVVITPATLQGKIDAQITPEISSKLPLAGGTMEGNIDMGGQNIIGVNTLLVGSLADQLNIGSPIGLGVNLDAQDLASIINLPAPTDGGDAANKTYVDDQDALKLSLTGGTMSGTIDMNGAQLLAASISNSALTTNLNANDNKITSLLAPTDGGDATNKTYVDGAASTAQANAEAYADSLAPNYDAAGSAAQALTDANNYTNTGLATKLDLAGGPMSGDIDMGNHVLNNAGEVAANYVRVSNLLSRGAEPILVTSNLDANNANAIINLPAPINNGDAANKEYVDTSIANTKFNEFVPAANWSLNDGAYTVTLTHNLSSYGILFSAMNLYHGTFDEFSFKAIGENAVEVRSNILPTEEYLFSILKTNTQG